MNSAAKSALIRVGVAVGIVASVGGLYLYLTVQARTDSFRALAELRAWALADRVAFELQDDANGKRLEFLVRAFVIPGGNVLYAQVLEDGEPLVETTLLDSPIPSITSPIEAFQIAERWVGPRPVWEVQQTLPDGIHAIRIGLSARTLDSFIRDQTALVVGIGVAMVVLTAGLTLISAPRSAVDAPAAPSSASISERQIGELIIDGVAKRVEVRGFPVELSPKEFELLSLLAESPGRVYANDEILQRVWPDNHLAGPQDVKQYIYFLRQKLEADPKHPQLIVTVRGFGYKLEPEV